MSAVDDAVLRASGVSKVYGAPGGRGAVNALADVDFDIRRGQTRGIVGESGSGKTTLSRMLLGLEQPTEGQVTFQGTPLNELSDGEQKRYRHSVAAVFQNPYSSLDPRMRIWQSVTEQHAIERSMSKPERRARADELLDLVGLDTGAAERYPHQLSGGQRQRVAIARAVCQDPDVIVLDEPLSALDVSVSAQIVNLLLDLQDRLGVSYVFIGHDLRLVRHLCHDVAVMYQGRIVEQGTARDVLQTPVHPYTSALLQASELTSLDAITDEPDLTPVPDTADSADAADTANNGQNAGCAYRQRCQRADDRCAAELPSLTAVAVPASVGGGAANGVDSVDDGTTTGAADEAAIDGRQLTRCHHPLLRP